MCGLNSPLHIHEERGWECCAAVSWKLYCPQEGLETLGRGVFLLACRGRAELVFQETLPSSSSSESAFIYLFIAGT